jgi:hypothetical protein
MTQSVILPGNGNRKSRTKIKNAGTKTNHCGTSLAIRNANEEKMIPASNMMLPMIWET